MTNKAVFLDRDGVINETKGFVTKFDEIKMFQCAAKAIQKFNQLGYKVIVVTNQAVVAKGLCTEEDVKKINNKISDLLKEQGAIIDAFYFCPHHPEKHHKDVPEQAKKYRIECNCRKPGTGMFEQAKKDFDLDFSSCFMIGDQTCDVQAGKNIGCRTILLETGYGGKDGKINVKPDYTCSDLLDASGYVEFLSTLKAVILVGGRGERLKPLTDTSPKPMVPVKGKPVLQYQIELLKQHGVRNIVLCGHYLFEKIKDYFGNGEKFGVNIEYVDEETPLGTGGGIKNAERLIHGSFLVFMGDILTNLNLTSLIDFHIKHHGLGTLVIRETDHPDDSDLVKVDNNNKVLRIFKKHEKNKEGNLANTGFFVFNREILNKIPNGISNLEGDILYNIVGKEIIYGYLSSDYIKDVGTMERYKNVNSEILTI